GRRRNFFAPAAARVLAPAVLRQCGDRPGGRRRSPFRRAWTQLAARYYDLRPAWLPEPRAGPEGGHGEAHLCLVGRRLGRRRGDLPAGAAPGLGRRGAGGISVSGHDTAAAAAPAPVPVPAGEDPHVAQVSAWFDSYDRRGEADQVIAGLGLASAGYLVTES